MIALIR